MGYKWHGINTLKDKKRVTIIVTLGLTISVVQVAAVSFQDKAGNMNLRIVSDHFLTLSWKFTVVICAMTTRLRTQTHMNWHPLTVQYHLHQLAEF